MGMSKEEKALYAQLTAAISQLQNPKSNPAQDFLSTQALQAGNWLAGGDYRAPPKGVFLNFDTPDESIKDYKKYADVGQGGTFALGDNAGRGDAQNLQSKYLSDKFARDATQNYQNNVANVAGNVQGALGQVSNATSQNQQAVISSLNSLFNSDKLKKTSIWGQLLGTIGGLGQSALGAAGAAGGFGALF